MTWCEPSGTVSSIVAGHRLSPPFEWGQITMGDREDLTAIYPSAAERIVALTRTG